MARTDLRAEDVLPVHSRVSWGAIVAGLFVTFAVFFILTALGMAIGLTVGANGPDAKSFTIGAGIYTFVITLISLFFGGWVSSQFAIGEGKFEAAIYGMVLWGLFFSCLYFMVLNGAHLGTNLLTGAMSSAPAQRLSQSVGDDQLRALGVAPDQAAQAATDPVERERLKAQAAEGARQAAADTYPAAWGTFGALLISLLVTMGGALAGCGPSFIVRTVSVSSATYVPPPPPPMPR